MDISDYGADGSNYSMMIQRYTTDRMRQPIDTRCFLEGQEFLISAKFRLANSTDLSSGLSCSPSTLRETDSEACPTVTIRGENCASGNLVFIFWNESNDPWDADGFNNYEKVYTVSADMASCEVRSTNCQYPLCCH